MWPNIPQLKLGNIREYSPIFKTARVAKKVWRIINTIASIWGENMLGYLSLLYRPTQIRFLIGGERVTCHWSKPNDTLGRTKLNDALGKQQLELWTRTWSRCAPWNRGRPDVKSHWSRTFLIRDGIHYSRKGIYSRKNISYRLTKGKIWTFVSQSLWFGAKNGLHTFVNSLVDRSRQVGKCLCNFIYDKIWCSWSNQIQNAWVKR